MTSSTCLRNRQSVEVVPLATRRSETVLVVEDDEGLRVLTRVILESQGYTVLEAQGAAEALRFSTEYPDEIDLLLADVVLPDMYGPEINRRLVHQRPALKVLFMSGYLEDTLTRHGIDEDETTFLAKPFSPSALMRKIREILDRA